MFTEILQKSKKRKRVDLIDALKKFVDGLEDSANDWAMVRSNKVTNIDKDEFECIALFLVRNHDLFPCLQLSYDKSQFDELHHAVRVRSNFAKDEHRQVEGDWKIRVINMSKEKVAQTLDQLFPTSESESSSIGLK